MYIIIIFNYISLTSSRQQQTNYKHEPYMYPHESHRPRLTFWMRKFETARKWKLHLDDQLRYFWSLNVWRGRNQRKFDKRSRLRETLK